MRGAGAGQGLADWMKCFCEVVSRFARLLDRRDWEGPMGSEIAITANKILGSKPSDDGKFGLIGLLSGKTELPLAVPQELLNVLAYTALNAKAECDAKSGTQSLSTEPQSVEAFPCERWEFGVSPDGSAMILGFRMPGGGWARFQVPRQWAASMRETLEAIEGRATAPPPQSTRN